DPESRQWRARDALVHRLEAYRAAEPPSDAAPERVPELLYLRLRTGAGSLMRRRGDPASGLGEEICGLGSDLWLFTVGPHGRRY
ncbi:MAG: hypothetical protein ACE5EV_03635, partial [Gaiellales bacterium]